MIKPEATEPSALEDAYKGAPQIKGGRAELVALSQIAGGAGRRTERPHISPHSSPHARRPSQGPSVAVPGRLTFGQRLDRAFASLDPRRRTLLAGGAAALALIAVAVAGIGAVGGGKPPLPAVAATPAADNSAAAVAFLRAKGNNLIPLPDTDGLKTFLVLHDGVVPQPVVISPGGQRLILGAAVDLGGRQTTLEDIAAALARSGLVTQGSAAAEPPAAANPAPAALPAVATAAKPALPAKTAIQPITATIFAQAEAANWISFGSASAPVLYMVADPNCPWCKQTWPMLKPLIDAGKLHVRLIPIGLVNKEKQSFAKAVALFNAENPQEAWQKTMSGEIEPAKVYRIDAPDELDKRLSEETKKAEASGAPLNFADKAKIRQTLTSEVAVLANHDFLKPENADITATPAFFFRGADKSFYRYLGAPTREDLNAIYAELTGRK